MLNKKIDNPSEASVPSLPLSFKNYDAYSTKAQVLHLLIKVLGALEHSFSDYPKLLSLDSPICQKFSNLAYI